MDKENRLMVGIGDIKVGRAPCYISTSLGSCISVCLYSNSQRIGGMLHLMLGSAKQSSSEQVLKKAKYADTGIPELLSQLNKSYGVTKKDLTAKIFGGAKVLESVKQEIGRENEVATRSILKELGIKVVAAKTGGNRGYRVEFYLETGKVLCQVFGEASQEY